MTELSGTLDERYLSWLYRQIGPLGQLNPARSYWHLASLMFRKQFAWFVPNDDNRIADGLDLRTEFIEAEEGGVYDNMWMEQDCSVLEMLIALSRKVAFETDSESYTWFWTFADNLGMRGFVDEQASDQEELIDEILNTLIARTYDKQGRGGIFPLRHSGQDQRKVEIWYQMSAYLMENHNV